MPRDDDLTHRLRDPPVFGQFSPADWALRYAARGWPVFPTRYNRDPDARKVPLTAHGMLDATLDAQIIREWWDRWPNAFPSILTGEPSDVVALYVDIRRGRGANGFDSLGELGIAFHPLAPPSHSPRGGCA